MERYLTQLVADIEKTIDDAPYLPDLEWDTIIEISEYDEEQPICEILGIDPGSFPPRCQLTNEQAVLITNALIELFAAYRLTIWEEDKYDRQELYGLLVKQLPKLYSYFPNDVNPVVLCFVRV